MANAVVYVDSAAAGANNGTSWVNAYTTLTAAITASGTTGTDFYVSSAHSESGVSLSLAFKGVAATPDRAFSCGKTHSPPQTADLALGAAFASTAGAVVVTGYVYIYGFAFSVANTNGGDMLDLANSGSGDVTIDGCTVVQTAALQGFCKMSTAGTSVGARVTIINTTFKFAASGSGLFPQGGPWRWLNTPNAIDATGTLPTALFPATASTRSSIILLDGVDLSAMSAKAIVGAGITSQTVQLVNCKMPASVTLGGTPTAPGATLDYILTDSTVVSASSFVQTRVQYQGTLTADNTVYNGATDGVNPISWKVVSTANSNPQSPFECFEIVQWAAAGTYAASKIFATSATGALTNSDIWVDVEYMASAASPQASKVTSGNTNQLPQGSSPASVTTGATWATGGAGTNYSLDIPSFTTALAGYVRFKVMVGKPSLTIYIDPKATIA